MWTEGVKKERKKEREKEREKERKKGNKKEQGKEKKEQKKNKEEPTCTTSLHLKESWCFASTPTLFL